jgi:hypothetical protein
VLVHGFTARLEEFLLQRETLRGPGPHACCTTAAPRAQPRARAVRDATIDQLGPRPRRVLDAVAPTGRSCCWATRWAA